MRAIDGDALKKALVEHMDAFLDSDGSMMYSDHLLCGADYEDLCEFIDKQPTIQPEPHWIPVTEPPKGDFMPYYATCRSKVDDRENWVIEGMYTKYSGWKYPPMVRDDRAEIIAWMPKELPEPYKGVTE